MPIPPATAVAPAPRARNNSLWLRLAGELRQWSASGDLVQLKMAVDRAVDAFGREELRAMLGVNGRIERECFGINGASRGVFECGVTGVFVTEDTGYDSAMNRFKCVRIDAEIGGRYGNCSREATPLHFALVDQRWDVVQYLLSLGADIRLPAACGASAHDMAIVNRTLAHLENVEARDAKAVERMTYSAQRGSGGGGGHPTAASSPYRTDRPSGGGGDASGNPPRTSQPANTSTTTMTTTMSATSSGRRRRSAGGGGGKARRRRGSRGVNISDARDVDSEGTASTCSSGGGGGRGGATSRRVSSVPAGMGLRAAQYGSGSFRHRRPDDVPKPPPAHASAPTPAIPRTDTIASLQQDIHRTLSGFAAGVDVARSAKDLQRQRVVNREEGGDIGGSATATTGPGSGRQPPPQAMAVQRGGRGGRENAWTAHRSPQGSPLSGQMQMMPGGGGQGHGRPHHHQGALYGDNDDGFDEEDDDDDDDDVSFHPLGRTIYDPELEVQLREAKLRQKLGPELTPARLRAAGRRTGQRAPHTARPLATLTQGFDKPPQLHPKHHHHRRGGGGGGASMHSNSHAVYRSGPSVKHGGAGGGGGGGHHHGHHRPRPPPKSARKLSGKASGGGGRANTAGADHSGDAPVAFAKLWQTPAQRPPPPGMEGSGWDELVQASTKDVVQKAMARMQAK